MQFFDRFRRALARYADGVHDLGAPAIKPALAVAASTVGPLPPAYVDFLTQWNGAFLFLDSLRLFGVEGAHPELLGLRRDERGLRIGEAHGETLYLDDQGRVLAWDAATESGSVVGSDFVRWLDAVMAREALLLGRDGEFREEAFVDGEVDPRVARKRNAAAIKADPDAPAWHGELAELLEESGDLDGAIVALQRTVTLDPACAAAWFSLGRLLRQRGDDASALAAYREAGGRERDPAEAGFAYAQAAAAALRLGDQTTARELAAQARATHPELLDEQRGAAEHLVAAGELDEGLARLELARVLAPEDEAVAQLLSLARARRSLRPLPR